MTDLTNPQNPPGVSASPSRFTLAAAGCLLVALLAAGCGVGQPETSTRGESTVASESTTSLPELPPQTTQRSTTTTNSTATAAPPANAPIIEEPPPVTAVQTDEASDTTVAPSPQSDAPSTDGDVIIPSDTEQAKIDEALQAFSHEEIEAMTDDEFFAVLDEAGVDLGVAGTDSTDSDGFDDGGIDAPQAEVDVVDGNVVTAALDPALAPRVEKLWNRFATVIPAERRSDVTRFELTAESFGGAYVHESANGWTLGISEGLGDDLDEVIVHEFAHLLTLNSTQVDSTKDSAETCTVTYFAGDSCARPDSILNTFVQRFWPQDDQDALAEIVAMTDLDEQQEAGEQFYNERKDRFVTDYAATDPAEDLAEVFAVFVSTDRPTGDSVADQKVLMFWELADMVELRQQLRTNAKGGLDGYSSHSHDGEHDSGAEDQV